MDIHLLPGLGADHRLFSRFLTGLPGRHVHDWPRMGTGAGLRRFAEVMADRVDIQRPHALVGVSMGGMVAQEMAAITRPLHTIIISSWKGPQEMPLHIRSLRGTRPERLITGAMLRHLMPMVRWQMGVETPDETALLEEFMHVHTVEQIKVQVAAVLDWEGPRRSVQGLVHIHGDHDRLMPVGLVEGARIVKGGTHFMVFSKALQVERIVREVLGLGNDRGERAPEDTNT